MKEEPSLFHSDVGASEAAEQCIHESDKKEIDMVRALGLSLKEKVSAKSASASASAAPIDSTTA
eukprot:294085-Amphidinium_carterae.1